MNRNPGMRAGQLIGTMNGQQVVGLDIAKQVFQLHTVDMCTGEIVNMQLKRAKVLQHLASKPACLIAMEACGGAHHWARQFTALGHTVRLLHAKIVRPFVTGNKTDATDARAIWLAVQQPKVKFVGMKTAEQQATLTLHRQRELLMKMRNMQSNALRGLLYEFGAVFAKGQRALFSELEPTLESLSGQLPQIVVDSLREPKTSRASTSAWRCTSGPTRKCGALPRSLAWACSRPRPPLPRWGTPTPSNQGVSSAPGSDWSPTNAARVAKCAWATSPNAVIPICAPYSFTAPEAYSPMPNSPGHGSKPSAIAGPPT